MRASALACVHVSPASSERYNPALVAASINAYTRRPTTATPERRHAPVGSPRPVSSPQCSPPSVDFHRPLPGPSIGAYTLYGGRRPFHMVAKITFVFAGSQARSTAPTLGMVNSTLSHVWPPFVERKTPRSSFGP